MISKDKLKRKELKMEVWAEGCNGDDVSMGFHSLRVRNCEYYENSLRHLRDTLQEALGQEFWNCRALWKLIRNYIRSGQPDHYLQFIFE